MSDSQGKDRRNRPAQQTHAVDPHLARAVAMPAGHDVRPNPGLPPTLTSGAAFATRRRLIDPALRKRMRVGAPILVIMSIILVYRVSKKKAKKEREATGARRRKQAAV